MKPPGNLYLTGYRGSGKTSVGKELATGLGLDAVDLDDIIERAANKSIQQIFADEGESGFRDREQAALDAVACGPISVVALGGGAILRAANRRTVCASGRCVWLDADYRTLARRIQADATSALRRPSLTDFDPVEEVRRLLSERQPFYEQVADLRVETAEKSVCEIAEEVLDWLDQEMNTR